MPAAVVHLLVGQHGGLRTVHAEAELHAAVRQGKAKEVADAAVVQVKEQPRGHVGLELEAQVAARAGIPAEVAGPLVGEAHELEAQAEPQQRPQQDAHLQGEENRVGGEAHRGSQDGARRGRRTGEQPSGDNPPWRRKGQRKRKRAGGTESTREEAGAGARAPIPRG